MERIIDRSESTRTEINRSKGLSAKSVRLDSETRIEIIRIKLKI